RVRDAALGAYEHQDLPFERLVRELDVERSLSRHPLFDVMFVLEEATPSALAITEDVVLEPLATETRTAKFDFTLTLRAGANGLAAEIEYAMDLFDPSTIEGMAASFVGLLRAVAAHPERPVGELPMAGEAERAELLEAFNATAVATHDACLHELF